MPVERLVQSIGTSPDAVAGLRAMANELGGRRGQRLLTLASQIERGSHVQNTDASHSTILPTSLIGVAQSVERLPRWFMLEELRDQARSRVQAVVWYSLFYCLTASVIGFAIVWMIPTLVPEFDVNFWWSQKKFEPLKIEPIRSYYQLLIGLFLIFTLIWVMHQILRHFRPPKWRWLRVQTTLDLLISHVPFIGSAWAAIELAQISETLHQSLASRWPYPDALRAAALQTESAMLRS